MKSLSLIEPSTCVRSESLINSCTSFGMEAGIGLGLAGATWILAFGGYDGTAVIHFIIVMEVQFVGDKDCRRK